MEFLPDDYDEEVENKNTEVDDDDFADMTRVCLLSVFVNSKILYATIKYFI